MKLKTIFFGTPRFALPSLERLAQAPFLDLVGVVTQPPKPQGRGLSVASPPVLQRAQELGLPTFTPERLIDFLPTLDHLCPDIGVCVAYGSLLPPALCSFPRYRIVNVHPSLLPKYRGASPIQEAILHGDTKTGVTLMLLDETLDGGPVLAQEPLPLSDLDTAESLSHRLAYAGAALLTRVLPDYVRGVVQSLPQVDQNATYCQKIEKESGRIDWQLFPAATLLRRLRAFSPWPGLFTFVDAKRLKILAATVAPAPHPKSPGTIEMVDDRFSVHTRDGLFQPKLVQLEGKTPMAIEDFFRGYQDQLPSALPS